MSARREPARAPRKHELDYAMDILRRWDPKLWKREVFFLAEAITPPDVWDGTERRQLTERRKQP